MRRGLTAAGLVTLVLGAMPAAAHAVACGDQVMEDTTLTEDLQCPGEGVNLHSGVTFDLGGHTIRGSGAGTAIQTQPGASHIVIRNGTVTSFVNGVFLRPGSSMAVEDIVTTGNSNWGLVAHNTAGIAVRNVTATGNGGLPISLHNTSNGFVRDSTAHGGIVGSWNGLQVADATNMEVFENEVTANVVGLIATGTNVNVHHNVVNQNRLGIAAGGTGIVVSNNTTDRNAPLDGIEIGDSDVVVRDNVARNNARWGIHAPGSTDEDSGNSAGGNGMLAQCEGIACTILDPQPSWTGNDFGTVDVGQSRENVIRLANSGVIDLVLGAGPPTVGGAHPGDFTVLEDGCGGDRLRDGEACSVRVRFAPRAGGARSAYLEWPAGTSSGTQRIPLQGRGQQCFLTRLNANVLGSPLRVCI